MTNRFLCSVSLLLALSAYPAFGDEASPVPQPGSAPPTVTQEKPAQLNILSIIPAQGEPGMTVTISGSGFTDDTSVFLATTEIQATVIPPRQLSFEIPDLPAGLYALFLKREDGAVSRAYSFILSGQRPVAVDLNPETIYSCAAQSDRQVTISGHNFRQGVQVLFDGAAIRSRLTPPDALTFTTPQVPGGLHQIQVKNPDGTLSGILGLMIDSKPEVTNITTGEEFVNYYNLVIEGRNFQQGSTVVIMEEKSLELVGPQLAVDVKQLRTGGGGTENERVVYLDCNRIIYQRHPYSSVPKNFKVQVLNPDGSQSAILSVSAP